MTAQTTQIAANEGRTLSLSEILRRCDLLNIGSSQEDASQRAAAVVVATSLLLSACGGGGSADVTASMLADAQVVQAQSPQAQALAGPRPLTQPAPSAPPPAGTSPVNPQGAGRAGSVATASAAGAIDHTNPFFRPFDNGRSCASCHNEADGWSITPQTLQARFNASNGDDPVFRLVDGANSPDAAVVTTAQKRNAYSMLLNRGVIRIGLPIPSGAEFTLAKADDPYGFASAAELSLFRRPLPSTNLSFLASVMWDGRETMDDPASSSCIAGTSECFATIDADLLHQANSAVRGHAEATQDLSAADERAIVDFEKALFTAKVSDNVAGSLTAAGALGGPDELMKEDFYFGINDPVSGDYRTGAPFNPNAMMLFAAWRNIVPQPGDIQLAARASIARGENLFNTRPINIAGVPGLNDVLRTANFRGTCTTCHNVPNAGSHDVPRFFNTGVAVAQRRTADLPLYTLRRLSTGETVQTTDPGRALISGKWTDIGRFKVPNLRGLDARPPYFHDGSARSVADVVRFYDTRFRMGLTPQEAADLTAFLRAL
ncbi:MAG TPA: cytochrome C [Noviherbaspirillum sp.]